MKIYCERCTYVEEVGDNYPPSKCPKCEGLDLRFEDEKDWHPVCKLWAKAHGWKEKRHSSLPKKNPAPSLPEWYYRKNKLEAWRMFKEPMCDPKSIIPPDSITKKRQGYERSELLKYWYTETGLIAIWWRVNGGLSKGFLLFPTEEILWIGFSLPRRLFEEYREFWNRKATTRLRK